MVLNSTVLDWDRQTLSGKAGESMLLAEKAATDRNDHVPIKLYLQKQGAGQIWPLGHNLPPPAPNPATSQDYSWILIAG